MTAKKKATAGQRRLAKTGNGGTKRKKAPSIVKTATAPSEPIIAPGSPNKFRARVRMYRHGLGDCFLLTFPRSGKAPFNILIDCGALARNAQAMTTVVNHIKDSVKAGGSTGKARLDVVVGTHEHKDHVSGFNQARKVFNDEFDFGAVWMSWAEDITKAEIKKIKETRKRTASHLRALLSSNNLNLANVPGVQELLAFSEDEDTTGSGKVAEAMEYLKLRGRKAGDLRFLEPGDTVRLDDVDDVVVRVLGPPRDPTMLKTSAVTETMKRQEVVYHLSAAGPARIDALAAALPSASPEDAEKGHPFAAEHRISKQSRDAGGALKPNPYFKGISQFLSKTYGKPNEAWRRIDTDWLSAFGQLALDLDNDTNNTSLVLAFEIEKSGEVLLFVADAQVGSWLSWKDVSFSRSEGREPLLAHDLLRRCVFYKVGHHCSHNATLKTNGLELMTRDDLVAFIPLDIDTAQNQGAHGWEMPAQPLFNALKKRANERVVISDVKQSLTPAAVKAGVIATNMYIDYFLK